MNVYKGIFVYLLFENKAAFSTDHFYLLWSRWQGYLLGVGVGGKKRYLKNNRKRISVTISVYKKIKHSGKIITILLSFRIVCQEFGEGTAEKVYFHLKMSRISAEKTRRLEVTEWLTPESTWRFTPSRLETDTGCGLEPQLTGWNISMCSGGFQESYLGFLTTQYLVLGQKKASQRTTWKLYHLLWPTWKPLL